MKNNGDTTEDNRDSGILSNPLSFLRSGIFYWSSADPYDRGGSGYYWSLRSATTTHSCNLNFGSTGLNPQNLNDRGNGYAVRCVKT